VLVLTALAATICGGLYAIQRVPLDALPDLSDAQVIIHTRWNGEPPAIIEDQVTYPIVARMLGAPRVKSVRAQTMPGDSFVYVIFQDGTNLYWARSRVLEYLQQLSGRLPHGITPVIGPDATGAGWVYEYVLVDRSHRRNLADLRALQDFRLRYALEAAPGVAEVASIGGFVRQYQVRLDPARMFALGVSLRTVIRKIRQNNGEAGGGVIDASGAAYMVRGLGYIRSLSELGNIAVAYRDGTPVLLRDLGQVTFGPELRRGAADWNGDGEVVGGIVIMRYGANALAVIRGVKRRLAHLRNTLPPGVKIVAGYDRTGLIEGSIDTLGRALVEEALIVSLVTIVFLMNFRAALIPILSIPCALLASFIPMYMFGISTNIMSLGGFILAIGVLVDASIVIVENGHRRYSDHLEGVRGFRSPSAAARDRERVLIESAREVGRPIFYSMMIIAVSFLPIFLLQGREGRMFRPLAYSKTFAIVASAIIAVTVAPVLMASLSGVRLRTELQNPVSRFCRRLYLPVVRWCLVNRRLTICAIVAMTATAAPLLFMIGSRFMPSLYEASTLYMPSSAPGISMRSAVDLLKKQDRILRGFPEVKSVFGTVGRSDSATDNAPADMFDTTIMLKPRAEWPRGVGYDALLRDMNSRLNIPGVVNSWTMPVAGRLDMESTGIKSEVGLKLRGPNLDELDHIGMSVARVLAGVKGSRDVFAERANQGLYAEVIPDRDKLSQYGMSIADVHDAVSDAIGGSDVAFTVDGRDRFAINVRYLADYRSGLGALDDVLVDTPAGARIPLSEVAKVRIAPGPTMIRDDNGELASYVFLDLASTDYGGYITRAQRALDARLKLPPGYTIEWSGDYKFAMRAERRLRLIAPAAIATIAILLYMLFGSGWDVLLLLAPCVCALSGGLIMQYLTGFDFSVAAAIGYLDLFGIAVETGVIMILYLNDALNRAIARGPVGREEIHAATIEGAVGRLRPKLMTVSVVILSLAPIMFERGIGSDVLKPIAAPIIGGMITSTIYVLILLPVLFAMLKERELRRGTLVPAAEETPPGHVVALAGVRGQRVRPPGALDR
jgi:Cu(I)/Ag(I) efflux system membrane protein CusA/SilA